MPDYSLGEALLAHDHAERGERAPNVPKRALGEASERNLAMRRSQSLARFVYSYVAAIALTGGLAACSARMGTAFEPAAVPPNASWMAPAAKTSALLYLSDWTDSVVYVYTYPGLKYAGTLTGFDYPYGMCVDKRGDVYITNWGSGTTLEYAHGGTSPINSYVTGGETWGCSISAGGDLATTDYLSKDGGGEVCVWKHGKGNSTCYSDPDCSYMWPFGYDHKGDLAGLGENRIVYACALPAGAGTMETLHLYGPTIHEPGGTVWDGEYITVTDRDYNYQNVTAIFEEKLTRTRLIPVGKPTMLGDNNCFGNYTDIFSPFFVGDKNVTAATTKRAPNVAGINNWCNSGALGFEVWKYPKGGLPIQRLVVRADEAYGVAISIAK